MEDTHGEDFMEWCKSHPMGLNPYYNGRYSWSRSTNSDAVRWPLSLNPYYNGRYSWSSAKWVTRVPFTCLNPYYNGRYSWSNLKLYNLSDIPKVLILIIMEDTHGASSVQLLKLTPVRS